MQKRTESLVGRLGFEPRLSASKAPDLPLIDRPVSDPSFKYSWEKLLCEHIAPVQVSRQGRGHYSLHAMLLKPLLSGARICLRPVKAKHCGTGTRERDVNGTTPLIPSHQVTLDFAKKGILTKNYFFKVVFYPDPGEREKGILGDIDLRTARIREGIGVMLLTGAPMLFFRAVQVIA